jgi:epsilon-lactone hydrolase
MSSPEQSDSPDRATATRGDPGLRLRAATADVEVTLDITPRVPHVFQSFYPVLDEAGAAMNRAGQFLSAHLA